MDSDFESLRKGVGNYASPWVDKEVATWLEHRGVSDGLSTLLIALTSGDLDWDNTTGDFVRTEQTPLPISLAGRFAGEPFWVDVRQYRLHADRAHKKNVDFASRAGKIAAHVLGIPLEDLLSEEVLQQRAALRLAGGAVVGLLLLSSATAWQWRLAAAAEEQALQTLALGDQQRAVELFTRTGDTDDTARKPFRALAYLAHAIRAYQKDDMIGKRALYLIGGYPSLIPASSFANRKFVEANTAANDRCDRSIANTPLVSRDRTWMLHLGAPLEVRKYNNNTWTTVPSGTPMGCFSFAAIPDEVNYAFVAGESWLESGGDSEVEVVDDAGTVVDNLAFDGELISRIVPSPDGRLALISLYAPRNDNPGVGDRHRTVIVSVESDYYNVEHKMHELYEFNETYDLEQFSYDSQLLRLNNRVYNIGTILKSEPLPLIARSGNESDNEYAFYSRSGDQIFTYSHIEERQFRRKVFDAHTGAALSESKTIQIPEEIDLSSYLTVATSDGRVIISLFGNTLFECDANRIILVGVDRSAKQIILIRDDGKSQYVELSAVSSRGEWQALKAIYGLPWQTGNGEFITVSTAGAQLWRLIYRDERLRVDDLQRIFREVMYDLSAGSTIIALHRPRNIAAIGSAGHSVADVRLIGVMTGLQLIDTIVVANVAANPFFSIDGRLLYVFAPSEAGGLGKFEIREIENGLPMTEPKELSGPFAERPDRKRLLDAGEHAVLFDHVGGDGPVPLWVADLAEGVAGIRVNEKNVIVPLSWDERLVLLNSVRETLASAPIDDRWADFGRWYLSDNSDPLISPYATMRRSKPAALSK